MRVGLVMITDTAEQLEEAEHEQPKKTRARDALRCGMSPTTDLIALVLFHVLALALAHLMVMDT